MAKCYSSVLNNILQCLLEANDSTVDEQKKKKGLRISYFCAWSQLKTGQSTLRINLIIRLNITT